MLLMGRVNTMWGFKQKPISLSLSLRRGKCPKILLSIVAGGRWNQENGEALWGWPCLGNQEEGDAISILLFSFLCYNALLRDSRRLIKFCKTGLCYDLEDWGTACGYTLGDCSRQPGEAGWELEWSREGGRRGDTWQLRSCKHWSRMISVMLGEGRRVKDRTSSIRLRSEDMFFFGH